MMINNVEEYLLQLRKEMSGCDRAIIQDALADAEEYLRNALENIGGKNPGIPEKEALQPILEEYGTPGEIAAAYKRIEPRMYVEPQVDTAETPPAARQNRSFVSGFFGIVADSRAWGSVLYLLFSLATGIIYFTWAVTGLSLSAGLLVLIIGLPMAGLFLFSVRGLALLEGRLVEALIGVRMPHRPIFSNRNLGLWGRFKLLVTDKYTWFSLAYMIILLPLGIIYFTLIIALFSASLWLIALPVMEFVFNWPFFTNEIPYYAPGWLMPLTVIGGILLFFGTMHLAKLLGQLQGKLAKAMLVRQ
jgi:hypothetical protein